MRKFIVNTDHTFEIDESKRFDWDCVEIKENQLHLLRDGKSIRIDVLELNREEKKVVLQIAGKSYKIAVQTRMDVLLEKMGMSDLSTNQIKDIKAPMPGLVLKVLVEPENSVEKGDAIMILEAMKMENVIKAAGSGVVSQVLVKVGEAVEKGQVLISFI